MLMWWSAGGEAQHRDSNDQRCELPPVSLLAGVRDERQRAARPAARPSEHGYTARSATREVPGRAEGLARALIGIAAGDEDLASYRWIDGAHRSPPVHRCRQREPDREPCIAPRRGQQNIEHGRRCVAESISLSLFVLGSIPT